VPVRITGVLRLPAWLLVEMTTTSTIALATKMSDQKSRSLLLEALINALQPLLPDGNYLHRQYSHEMKKTMWSARH
jgi:hypothetical protein